MIALLLNSGLGTRMGDETQEHPKCMTKISGRETIISWQLKCLERIGVTDAVVTTGHLSDMLEEYLLSLDTPIRIHFVHNPRYRETNYIDSMYLACDLLAGQEVLSLHGDLVMHPEAMARLAGSPVSAVTVDSTLPLPEKDFKAVWEEIPVYPLDLAGLLCAEIDNQADKEYVSARFAKEVLA